MTATPVSKPADHIFAEDVFFMRRCWQLAANGRGMTRPNPMVGAVVVHQGRIIGEGWHHRCGEPHAEPNAIRSVRQPELLKESTLYVSLEPCSHYGKTPPCAQLILDTGIPRVVVGCLDPFPKVSGRGVAMLRAAGVEVVTGIEEEACRLLNRAFIRYHLSHRPYVVLKWAQTEDGFIDCLRSDTSEPPLRISNPDTLQWGHLRRWICDAVLVGSGTARLDNPSLNRRYWPGEQQPLRVVIDRQGNLPDNLRLFDDRQPTLIFGNREPGAEWSNTQVLPFVDIPGLLDTLGQRGVQSLLVEGGRQLHRLLLDLDLWDELQIETSSQRIGEGYPAPELPDGIDLGDPGLVHQTYRPASGGRRLDIYIRPPR